MNTKLSYKQAIKNGWQIADERSQRKYVSRKVNLENQPVLAAGGHRKGEFYVEVPSWQSSRYSIRRYLTPPQTNN